MALPDSGRLYCLHLRLMGICMLLIGLTACSRTPVPIAGVAGTVTYEGKPVGHGTVLFISEAGFGASVPLKPDGSYLLRSHHGRGIPLGEYSVIITPPDENEDEITSPPPEPESYGNIPKKYRQFETSPLRFKVVDGRNHFNIELHSSPD